MYARVVRFSGVAQDQIDKVVSTIEDSDGPPPGVDSTGISLVYDKDQGTAVFVGLFATEEALKASDEALRAMDTGDTPGTRETIDMGEIVVERRM